ncbi:uracil-DNA glycosylase [Truepera radiovictrix]|uniref:Type-5 uracil-DNA glycosylase n=1 Tax=Truepera radiovictrix (strain DSM 17093 / CIP 108686 / LMG 22925 / RQ-24) TaxID=649638 RepID=D7CQJ9_TRURR|nr:uracil-DNA glycosylase [Truepera radiovictrix]ADI14983.1 Uracil-DNA glycosylase superfamily [Truepera radiovictrix DSM 17093]WMT56462.1 uracil-DNA glycosylase [Truepera radiovictrix]
MAEPFDPAPEALLSCTRCPRLVAHREAVARVKRRAYRLEPYWGRPVPGFGDPEARIVLLGLAPGAHGSNRTGRMFTGDGSGAFLYPALWRAGLANQPRAAHRDDGLVLRGVFITAAARCVPPDNKPTREELQSCRGWLARDFAGLPNVKVVVALGRVAHESYLELISRGQRLVKARYGFAHGALHTFAGAPPLLDAYHVSLQNTNTGRLTPEMFDAVLARAKELAGGD